MKKLLLNILLVCGFLLIGAAAMAAKTTPTYASNYYTAGATISLVPTFSNGNPTTSISVTTGTLPAGLSINTTIGSASVGTISGSVTTTGTYGPFKVTAYNGATAGVSANFYIYIVAAPSLGYTNPPAFTVGTSIGTISPSTNTGVAAYGYNNGVALSGATLSTPEGMATDPSGNVYVVNNGSNTISEWNSAGTYQGTFGTGIALAKPVGIVFASATVAYVLDYTSNNNGKVYEFVNGAYTAMTTPITGLKTATGIAIDNSGNLYVADEGAGKVYKYSSTGTLLLTIPTANLNNPYGVAVDQSGNIYVSNITNQSGSAYVAEFSSSGTFISNVIAANTYLTGPTGISIDNSGNIDVADVDNAEGLVFNSTGANNLEAFNGNEPWDEITDANGNIYVSDPGNPSVTKYSPIGGYYITSVTGGSTVLPAGLTFNSTTGAFSGTPTASFATTYVTVTAYNKAGTATTATITISCTTPVTIAAASITGGLAANPIVATGTQTVYGLQLSMGTTGASQNITGFTFTSAAGGNVNSYYMNSATLYSSQSATFNPASPTNVNLGNATSITTNTLAFSSVGTITVTANESPLYYFVVINYATPVPAAATWTLSLTSLTGPTVSTVTGTGAASSSGTTYNFSCLTITAANVGTPGTAGLMSSPVNTAQTYGGIYGVSLTPSGSGPSQTITTLTFTPATSQVDNYNYGTAYLYESTSPTFPGGSGYVASATMPTTANAAITFTTSGYTLSSTSGPIYFYIAISYAAPGATASNTQTFTLTSIGTVAFTGTPTGNTYTFQPIPTLTATDLTAGLTASTLTQGQSNIAVAGVEYVMNTSTTNLSEIVFNVSTSIATENLYFGTPTLVSCTSATYSAGASTAVTGATLTTGTGTPGTLTFDMSPNLTISTSPSYYFLVMNYSVSGGSVPQAFTFTPATYTTALTGTVTTGYSANSYNCVAPSLTENIVSSTGLAANPILGNQTNVAIYGMSLASVGTSTVTSMSFTASQTITTYFPSVTLYSSSSATFSTLTATSVASGAISGTSVGFSGISVPNGTTYYYLVVSYTESGTTPPASFQFTLASISSSPTATLNTVAGPVYTFSAGTYNWTGALSTAWTTAGNWSPNVVPGSYDVAQIGSATYGTYYQNIPTVSTGTQTVGSVSFNGNQYYTAPYGGGYYYVEGELLVSTGATFVVNGNISLTGDQEVADYYVGNDVILAGGGTIQCNNVTVNATYYYKKGFNYFLQMVNDGVTLQVADNIALTSTYDTEPSLYEPIFVLAAGTTTVNGVISTTNNNSGTNYGTSVLAFSTGLTAAAPATLNLTNATALSGLSSVGTNTITFNEPYATVAYSASGAQTVYTDAAITGLAAGNISYYDLTFSGSGIKTPNGTSTNNLYVAGNFTNSLANDASDYINLASTIVNFDGTVAQNLYPGTGNGTTFYNLTCSGTKATTISGGNAYIASNGTLNITGTKPTLATGGLLTLNADATGCAAVTQMTATAPISGNVNVQRYISGVRGYRLISSPVYSGTDGNGNKVLSLGYLGSYLYLTGTGSGSPHTGNPTLYLYDEGFTPQFTTFLNSNFIGIATLPTTVVAAPTYGLNTNGASLTGSYTIPVGNGVDVFYRGNALTQTGTVLTTPAPAGTFPTEDPSTTATSGTLNQNQVTFKEWYTPTSTKLGSSSQKFDLVGNPYACAIDLNTMQSTTTTTGIYATKLTGGNGVPGFIYELIPTGTYAGQYGVWTVGSTSATATNGASEYIASGEGFFVESTGTSTLIFNESAKATSTNANSFGIMARRMDVAAINVPGANPLLRLNMSMDSTSAEETVIAFNPSSSTGYVFGEDAPHHTGSGAVHFASRSTDSVAMMINSMPLQQTQTIPLNVYATNDGVYTINMTQPTPLPAIYDVWLKDAYTKDSLDIKNNPTYSFDISNSDANSYGTNRLTLVIRENPALMVHLLSFNAQKQPTGDNVVWSTENEANYTQFAVQRSTDGGKTFVVLDSLMSTAAGAYSYLDRTPVQGANSYRVQLTDLNGVRTYSSVVTIMYGNNANTITLNNMLVYPNPTTGPMNLAINVSTTTGAMAAPSYHIQVTNNMGIVVKNVTSNEQVWQSDMSNLLPGTYFITVTNASTNTQVGKSAFVKL